MMNQSLIERQQPEKVYELYELLINKKDYDEDTDACLICYGMARLPVRCQNCQGLFCKLCAENWSKFQKKCPKKCTDYVWNVKRAIMKKIFRFRCPYSERCPPLVGSDQIFMHLAPKKCPNRRVVEIAKCSRGHRLQTYNPRPQHKNKACATCKRKAMRMRQQCKQCEQLFCVSCKPLSLNKGICLQEHRHEIASTFGEPRMCDKCGRRTLPLEHGQIDYDCNIYVCRRCFDKLPPIPYKKQLPILSME